MAGPPRSSNGEANILHVDMDAFYAAVEVLDEPTLAGKPLIVGGAGPRGVVASCSYEARAYGVRSAMPSVTARRLCPEAVFVAGRFGRYTEVSRSIHEVFERYTPLVEGISLDEAFLDVSGSVGLFGPAPEIAAQIRAVIASELRLACSVGVAAVKFLAKLASEAAKPTAARHGVQAGPGVVVIRPGEELDFLHPLPIEALWGVGPATATRLRRLGVATVGDLARVPAETLESTIGRANGGQLARLARGIDERAVEPNREVKSISYEETYPVDQHDRGVLDREVVRMADAVATRMRRAGVSGRTVTVKIRFGDFVTRTRSHTSATALSDGPTIAARGCDLLDGVDTDRGVRLLGLGISNLVAVTGSVEQMSLDLGGLGPPGEARPPPGSRQLAADAMDAVRERFGVTAVGPATLLGSGGLRVKRPGDTQWGPSGPGDEAAG
jgi:DNA polymerase IV